MGQSSIIRAIAAVAALGSALLSGVGAASARTLVLAGAGAGTGDTARLAAGSATFSPTGITSVSCASPGNCGAVGSGDSSGTQQALVAGEKNGTWGSAQVVVPGWAPTPGQAAAATSVSCPSAGDCAAGGYYGPSAFVVSERHGTWSRAELVHGLAALGNSEGAEIFSVSCASPGNCGAGGFYIDASRRQQAFVVSEQAGSWGRAEQVPALGALNKGGYAVVGSVSCAREGNCSAGGFYTDSRGNSHAFAAGETNGTWGTATPIRGLVGPSTSGYGSITSLSCASAGNCSAGGYYASRTGGQAFVVSENHGRWGRAEQVPGLAALNTGGNAETTSVSCAPAGNCGAGGYYTGRSGQQAFVVSENHGRWGRAEQVPGLARLTPAGFAQIDSVSCASAGNCSAAGSTGYWKVAQPFVVSEEHRRWGRAELVPGLARLHAGVAGIGSVSCASAGNCSAGGSYGLVFYGRSYALVVSQKHGTWGTAQRLPAQRL